MFVRDGQLYAFKGLAGRLAPIGVHAAMLLIMLGCTVSGFGFMRGTVNITEVQCGLHWRGGKEEGITAEIRF